MNKTGLGVTVVGHGLLLLLALPSSRVAPTPGAPVITARLLPAVNAAAPAQLRPRPPPVLSRPVLLAPLPAPEFQVLAAAGVAAPATPATEASGAAFVAAAPALATPRAEPLPQARYEPAALPAEHGSCSARGIERHYPAMLRERGVQGEVLLRVQVNEQGRAAEVRVQGGSGWRMLDEAARQIAMACPYLPARRGEQRLVAWVEYPIRFALH